MTPSALSNETLDELLAAAGAATPGRRAYVHDEDRDDYLLVCEPNDTPLGRFDACLDAEFAAECTPERITAIITELLSAKAEIAALRSSPAVDGVGVKPLEFRAAQHPKRLQAVSIIGAYLVLRRGSKFALERQCGGPADLIGLFDSPDAATAAAQSHFDAAIRSALSPVDGVGEPVAWACVKCNSPRSVDPCPKCGTPLTKPADGWEWPVLPDIDRIRALAREVGYAIGVHGSLERDLDLIAVPWVENAIGPYGLALHIAAGLGGEVVDFKNQDKPCGRWSCNIHTPDWTKMIDLSVMPPALSPTSSDRASVVEECKQAIEAYRSQPIASASVEFVDGVREGHRRSIVAVAALSPRSS